MKFEDLRVLQAAEVIADSLWRCVMGWEKFAREAVGKQIVEAVDSIGANIAESFGRYNTGEKLQFLYYARGSLFETKYWLNRARERNLLTETDVKEYAQQLTDLARQINALARNLKANPKERLQALRERSARYQVSLTSSSDQETDDSFSDASFSAPEPPFSETDLSFLASLSSPNQQTTNNQQQTTNNQQLTTNNQ